jgi:hypothetical protein
MSQSLEAVGTAVTAQSLLGSYSVKFVFPADTTNTRSQELRLSPPSGTRSTFIALQGFNMGYTDEDYELQAIQVDLTVSDQRALCIATLRDRNDADGKGKKWQGTFQGLVTFFG